MTLKNRPTLSVITVCDNPISKEFYLSELLHSVLPIADEIIFVNASDFDYEQQEFLKLLSRDQVLKDAYYNEIIKDIDIPWSLNGKKNTYWMWKSVGIYQASCDYILRLDADEVLLDTQENYDKILKAMELGHSCYTAKVRHFWKDYTHILNGSNSADGGNPIYERRNYLFKNGLGYYENLYDICDVNGDPISADEYRHTSIEVYHYGGVRTSTVFLQKKNQIEKAYHEDWVDLKKWSWETSANVINYHGTHPKAMDERIKKFYEV